MSNEKKFLEPKASNIRKGASGETLVDLRMVEVEKKVIQVALGEILTVECLRDTENKNGYFLVKNRRNFTSRADEIVVGNTIYTADQRTRVVYRLEDGRWVEKEEFKNLPVEVQEASNRCNRMSIPLNAPLAQFTSNV